MQARLTFGSSPGFLVLAALLCAPFLLGSSLLQEDPEKYAAMEKIRVYLDNGEWRAARKKLKIYLKKHASTSEERSEISILIQKAKGFEVFEKIQKEYQRDEKARRAARKIQDLLLDFSDVPDLVKLAEECLETLRSQYIFVFDDFEGWPDPEAEKKMDSEERAKLGPRMTGLVLETREDRVKQGHQAGRWKSKGGGGSVSLPPILEDWTGFDFMCMWIFNEKVYPKHIQHLRVHVSSGGPNFFRALIALDWKGWKEIRLPLRGRKSPFGKYGHGEWSSVTFVFIEHVDSLPRPLDLVFDDVRLEKAVK